MVTCLEQGLYPGCKAGSPCRRLLSDRRPARPGTRSTAWKIDSSSLWFAFGCLSEVALSIVEIHGTAREIGDSQVPPQEAMRMICAVGPKDVTGRHRGRPGLALDLSSVQPGPGVGPVSFGGGVARCRAPPRPGGESDRRSTRSLTSSACQGILLGRACASASSRAIKSSATRSSGSTAAASSSSTLWSPPRFAERPLAARILHQNPPHRLRRGREEMTSTVPALRLVPDQPEIGFVDQCSRLQRLAGRLVGQLLGRQQTEFLIDQRQEFVCSLGRPPVRWHSRCV